MARRDLEAEFPGPVSPARPLEIANRRQRAYPDDGPCSAGAAWTSGSAQVDDRPGCDPRVDRGGQVEQGKPSRIRGELRAEQGDQPRTSASATTHSCAVPTIPTTGLTLFGGIIPAVRIYGTRLSLAAIVAGIDGTRTRCWDG